jgi:hypothetical protein
MVARRTSGGNPFPFDSLLRPCSWSRSANSDCDGDAGARDLRILSGRLVRNHELVPPVVRQFRSDGFRPTGGDCAVEAVARIEFVAEFSAATHELVQCTFVVNARTA